MALDPRELAADDFIYGWGRTKHIADPKSERGTYRGPLALCGASGGHPPVPQRPICKTCARAAGVTTPEDELKELRAEVARLQATNEELRAAGVARWWRSSDQIVALTSEIVGLKAALAALCDVADAFKEVHDEAAAFGMFYREIHASLVAAIGAARLLLD